MVAQFSFLSHEDDKKKEKMRCQKWWGEECEGEGWEDIYKERGNENDTFGKKKKLDIQQIAVFLFMSVKHILDQRQHLKTCMCR